MSIFSPNGISALLSVAILSVLVGALMLTEPPLWSDGFAGQEMHPRELAGYLLFALGIVLVSTWTIRWLMPRQGELGSLGNFVVAFVLTLGTMLVMAAAFYAFLTTFIDAQRGRLAIILLAGAFGGLVRQVADERKLTLMRFDVDKSEITPGSIGEVLIGMAAAAGLFLVLAGTMNFNDGQNAGSGTRRLIGFALIAGVSGRTILAQLKTVLQKKIDDAADKATKAAEDAQLASRKIEYRNYVNAGNQFQSLKEYESAIAQYEKAIELLPEEPAAYVGKGEALRSQALAPGVNSAARTAKLESALEMTETALAKDPERADAYYNRACYNALLLKPFAEVEPDLRKAFELKPEWTKGVVSDTDFIAATDAAKGLTPPIDYVGEVTTLLTTIP